MYYNEREHRWLIYQEIRLLLLRVALKCKEQYVKMDNGDEFWLERLAKIKVWIEELKLWAEDIA